MRLKIIRQECVPSDQRKTGKNRYFWLIVSDRYRFCKQKRMSDSLTGANHNILWSRPQWISVTRCNNASCVNVGRPFHAYPDAAHIFVLIVYAQSQSKMHLVRRHMTQKIIGKLAVTPSLKHGDERIFAEVFPRYPANLSEIAPALRGSRYKRGLSWAVCNIRIGMDLSLGTTVFLNVASLIQFNFTNSDSKLQLEPEPHIHESSLFAISERAWKSSEIETYVLNYTTAP